ncbi:hypothetical protein BC939DRAFT_469917 [Gamsiella multidivaricata]|uniref:uncharacterized protein n=1 Tax=Gamsiella multidivaricata TaxID=101098 RepID=UPI00221E7AA7|nr:uncharacterized protein BC939DRAFT_469917 [Gamsiella multidivaricata]KAI7816234.1 hypothetical protein BC939DRAFT_469917 [Gamsiella multidivaricata]
MDSPIPGSGSAPSPGPIPQPKQNPAYSANVPSPNPPQATDSTTTTTTKKKKKKRASKLMTSLDNIKGDFKYNQQFPTQYRPVSPAGPTRHRLSPNRPSSGRSSTPTTPFSSGPNTPPPLHVSLQQPENEEEGFIGPFPASEQRQDGSLPGLRITAQIPYQAPQQHDIQVPHPTQPPQWTAAVPPRPFTLTPSVSTPSVSTPALSSPATQGATPHQSILAGAATAKSSSTMNDLRMVMAHGVPILASNKITLLTAGECIFRAAVHILSRKFVYMTKSLFMAEYNKVFGCVDRHGGTFYKHNEFLDSRKARTIVESVVHDGRKYYRLVPSYFQGIAHSVGLPPLPQLENTRYDIDDEDDLPPIRPLGSLWHPEPRGLSPESAYWIWADALKLPFPESKTCPPLYKTVEAFEEDLLKAKGTGMEAKTIRKRMSRHSFRILEGMEKERQEELKRSVEAAHIELKRFLDGSQSLFKRYDTLSETRSEPMSLDSSDRGMEVDEHVPSTSLPVLVPASSTVKGPPNRNESVSPSRGSPTAQSGPETPVSAAVLQPAVKWVTMNDLPSASTHIKTLPQTDTHLRGLKEAKDVVAKDSMPGDSASTSHPILVPGKGETGTEVHLANLSLRNRIIANDLLEHPKAVASVDPGAAAIAASTFLASLDQSAAKESRESAESMDVDAGSSSLEQGRTSEYGSTGLRRASQKGQPKVNLTHQRFKPYPGSDSEGLHAVQRKEKKACGFIPPTEGGLFTLPRPALRSLQEGAFLTGITSATSTGQFLRTTRDQILQARREALEKVIEYTWTLPMRMGPTRVTDKVASSSPSPSTVLSPTL